MAPPEHRIEFCTILDEGFLIKGLVLHRSLQRHASDFRLTIFCDEGSKRILDALELPHLRALTLAELEAFDPDLLAVKPERSLAEYLWTSKASMINYLFAEQPERSITGYLDADQMFFGDPQPLFDEMGDASALITPHRFAPEYSHAVDAGIYNAGFLAFRRDERGRAVLEDWRARCLEWCFHRHEPDRSGDQKYLNVWPQTFPGVHVLEHLGGGLAPWNVAEYRLRRDDDRVLVDEQPVVFFHFHRAELRDEGPHAPRPAGYHVPRRAYRLIYEPFLAEVDRAIADIRSVEPGFAAGLAPRPPLRERLAKRADEMRLALLAHAGPLRRLKWRFTGEEAAPGGGEPAP